MKRTNLVWCSSAFSVALAVAVWASVGVTQVRADEGKDEAHGNNEPYNNGQNKDSGDKDEYKYDKKDKDKKNKKTLLPLSYSGEAVLLHFMDYPAVGEELVLGETGALPAEGGTLEAHLEATNIVDVVLLDGAHAAVVGADAKSGLGHDHESCAPVRHNQRRRTHPGV